MFEVVTTADQAVGFLKGLADSTDKASFEAANKTAWMARGKMRQVAGETQNEGIMGMRVRFATERSPQARLSTGTNWTEEVVSAPLTTEGARRAVGLFGGIRGSFVFLRGKYAPKGGKALALARSGGVGFFAQMVTRPRGPKLGLFMPHTGDKGWGRQISIFYSLKTPEQVKLLEAAGVDVVEKNFEKLFDEQFRRRLETMAGLRGA
jgi:hypothetical protein